MEKVETTTKDLNLYSDPTSVTKNSAILNIKIDGNLQLIEAISRVDVKILEVQSNELVDSFTLTSNETSDLKNGETIRKYISLPNGNTDYRVEYNINQGSISPKLVNSARC